MAAGRGEEGTWSSYWRGCCVCPFSLRPSHPLRKRGDWAESSRTCPSLVATPTGLELRPRAYGVFSLLQTAASVCHQDSPSHFTGLPICSGHPFLPPAIPPPPIRRGPSFQKAFLVLSTESPLHSWAVVSVLVSSDQVLSKATYSPPRPPGSRRLPHPAVHPGLPLLTRSGRWSLFLWHLVKILSDTPPSLGPGPRTRSASFHLSASLIT